MTKTTTGITAGAWLALAVLITPAARAENACTATAKTMLQVCKDEAKAELGTALGYCLNLAAKEARKPCRTAAKAVLAEAKEDCVDQRDGRKDFCEVVGPDPYDPVIDPASFLSPAATAADPNPYLPLVPGTVWTYSNGSETTVVTVTATTKVVQGVTTIVVRDVVSVGGQAIEDTDDYFAQHVDGTVWYFGELSKSFEDGELSDLHGSFRAGVDGAKAGIVMKAAPAVGDQYRQEFALGVAEDAAEVTSITGTESTPGGSCTGTCVVTRDFNLLEPGGDEQKFYAPDIGLILEIDNESGERNELHLGHALTLSLETQHDLHGAVDVRRRHVADRVRVGGDVAHDRLRRGQRRGREDAVEVLAIPILREAGLALPEHGASERLADRRAGREVQGHDRATVVPEALPAEIDLSQDLERELGLAARMHDHRDATGLVRTGGRRDQRHQHDEHEEPAPHVRRAPRTTRAIPAPSARRGGRRCGSRPSAAGSRSASRRRRR